MQAERKIQLLEKENSELKEEIEQLKTKCAQFEVLYVYFMKQVLPSFQLPLTWLWSDCFWTQVIQTLCQLSLFFCKGMTFDQYRDLYFLFVVRLNWRR